MSNGRQTSSTWRRPLILAGLLAVVAGAYYFWLSRPVGSGPAGPELDRARFEHVWTTRPVLFVGLGDSVTEGFGARKEYSYFNRLIQNPSDEFVAMRGICLQSVLPALRATNLSVSGSTSFEHVEKQLPRLKPADSNTLGIVVITTGGNDLIHNYGRTPPVEQAMYGATLAEAKPWVEGFAQRLERMREQIESAFPAGCHIFIADIFDPTDGVGDTKRAGLPEWRDAMSILGAYNDVLRRFAAGHSNVHLVPVHDTFLGHGIHCTQIWSAHYRAGDPHYWYFDNLEDPNERGYDAIRRLFLAEIAKVAEQLK